MATPLRRKILAAVLAPVLFLALAEAVLRLAGYHFDPVMPGASERKYDEWDLLDVYRPDPELLWTLKPKTCIADLSHGFARVQTNSLGLRGPEPPSRPDPDDLFVVCAGDSIVFGIGLEEADTLPERLAEDLRVQPALAGREVHVLNGGVPGWSSVQGRRLLDRLAPLDPDIVVFWYGMNDAQKARERPDVLQKPRDETVLRATTLFSSLRSFQLVQEGILSLGGGEDLRRVTPEQFRSTIDELVRGADVGGPVPVFVRTPQRMDLLLSQLEAVVRRATEEGTEKIYGPIALLSPIGPAPTDVDLVGRKISLRGRPEPALVFGSGRPEADSTLTAMRSNLKIAREVKAAFDVLMAELPADAVTAREMFGETPPDQVFMDNCHLTPLGSRLAAKALAARILKIVAK